MSAMEIVLLVLGAVLFVASFVIPDKNGKVDIKTKEAIKDEVKRSVTREIESVKGHIDDVVDETVNISMEKTERTLERLSNEKIMAVSEYSDTVLAEIHKNREEVMFLYDMLNNKQENLKDTVSEANKAAKEVEESKKEAEAVVSQFQKWAAEKSASEEDDSAPVPVVEDLMRAFGEKSTEEEIEGDGETVTDEVQEEKTVLGNNTLDISFMGEETGKNNNEKIMELYNQGKSNVAIARQLGLGVGEVKLVIDLYKNL